MRYRESIQQFWLPESKITIRVWRELGGEKLPVGHDDDVASLLQTMMHGSSPPSVDFMLEQILALPRVQAVEIKDKHGNGGVDYNGEVIRLPGFKSFLVI